MAAASWGYLASFALCFPALIPAVWAVPPPDTAVGEFPAALAPFMTAILVTSGLSVLLWGLTTGDAAQRLARAPRAEHWLAFVVAAASPLTGGLSGLVIYTMSEATACGFASRMMGETVEEFDAMAQSAVAELANMITGQASIGLEKNGYSTDMSPPVLLIGHGASIATFNLTRLVVPLVVSFGEFAIDIAVKESA